MEKLDVFRLKTYYYGPNSITKTFTSVLDCYAMAMGGNPTKWREGIKALRNLREHAKEVRDNLITAANTHAQRLAVAEVKVPSPSLHAYGPIPSVETRQDDRPDDDRFSGS